MKRNRLGTLLVGAGAAALAVFAVPAVTTATAGATSAASTFQLTNTGASVLHVGTTTWTATEVAGATGSPSTKPVKGTTALTKAAFKAAEPRIPDVGITVHPEGSATIASAPGTGKASSSGRSGHGKTGPTSKPGKVSGPTAGLTSIAGSDGFDQGILHPTYNPTTGAQNPLPGVDVEPPDQGLCAGNGYVMEVNNMVVQMFNSSTMQPLAANGMAMERFFDAPEVFGGANTGTYSVQGDPRCYYDPVTHRWFASQIFLTEAGDLSSPFGWAGEFVAASESTNPTGAWHVYFIPDQYDAQGVDHCNSLPVATLPSATNPTGAGNPCYGDQPLLGVNSNAVFISVNEYALAGNHPLGGVATEYALSKADLLAGTASPIYWGHLGNTVTRPGAGTCPYNNPAYTETTATICPWYSIVPAVSDGAYVTATGGTFYAASGVTFTTTGGDQVAVWKFTNTDAVTAGGPSITGSVTVASTGSYSEPPTSAVKGTSTGIESLATQEEGPHPLGTLWKTLAGTTPIKWPSGEGMIAVNTDRVTTAAYDPANGSVWAGINTATRVAGPSETGIFWASITPTGSGATLTATNVASGVVSAPAADVYFPSFAFTGNGKGLLDYVLSGPGYYPSTGYSTVTASGPTSAVHVARAGVGPADGFSEYTPSYDRPRWGDYSTTVATGTTFYFAAEMVNSSCSVKQFEATFTCGGTRDLEANWGTSVNKLT